MLSTKTSSNQSDIDRVTVVTELRRHMWIFHVLYIHLTVVTFFTWRQPATHPAGEYAWREGTILTATQCFTKLAPLFSINSWLPFVCRLSIYKLFSMHTSQWKLYFFICFPWFQMTVKSISMVWHTWMITDTENCCPIRLR